MHLKNNKVYIKFSSISENEQFARSCIQAFCLALNPTISELSDIKTAVSEAVTNCIVHAYPNGEGEIVLKASIDGNCLHISISDSGCGISDVAKAVEPFFTTREEDERSGMGFTVMKAFMDDVVVISRENEGTEVIMTKSFQSVMND